MTNDFTHYIQDRCKEQTQRIRQVECAGHARSRRITYTTDAGTSAHSRAEDATPLASRESAGVGDIDQMVALNSGGAEELAAKRHGDSGETQWLRRQALPPCLVSSVLSACANASPFPETVERQPAALL